MFRTRNGPLYKASGRDDREGETPPRLDEDQKIREGLGSKFRGAARDIHTFFNGFANSGLNNIEELLVVCRGAREGFI